MQGRTDTAPSARPRTSQTANMSARQKKASIAQKISRFFYRLCHKGMSTSTAPPSEPAAVILAGDLLKWIIPKVGKFPRSVRYGLGSRIESAHLDVLEELIHAQYARGADRARSLDYANRRLQVARHLMRMANEMKLISDKSAVYVAALQVDLGNQVGSGWIMAKNIGLCEPG